MVPLVPVFQIVPFSHIPSSLEFLYIILSPVPSDHQLRNCNDNLLKVFNNHHGDHDQLSNNTEKQQLITEMRSLAFKTRYEKFNHANRRLQ